MKLSALKPREPYAETTYERDRRVDNLVSGTIAASLIAIAASLGIGLLGSVVVLELNGPLKGWFFWWLTVILSFIYLASMAAVSRKAGATYKKRGFVGRYVRRKNNK